MQIIGNGLTKGNIGDSRAKERETAKNWCYFRKNTSLYRAQQ
jgi:hypothetical protein